MFCWPLFVFSSFFFGYCIVCPPFIEVPVPSQEREWSCICVLGRFFSFYDFAIGLWNCSDGVSALTWFIRYINYWYLWLLLKLRSRYYGGRSCGWCWQFKMKSLPVVSFTMFTVFVRMYVGIIKIPSDWKVWRYQRANQRSQIEEGQTIQLPKESRQPIIYKTLHINISSIWVQLN